MKPVYLNMDCKITIGSITTEVCQSIRIETSVTEVGGSAEVVLPKNFRNRSGKPILDFVKAGDPVTIWWGYNGKLNLEFEGYVKEVGAEMPLVIQCDDAFFPLKQNSFVKSYRQVSLKQLLKDIMPSDYKIDCPEAQIGKYQIDQESTYQVLLRLREEFGLFSRLLGKNLIIGYSYDWDVTKTKTWLYHQQKNVKESSLTWKLSQDYQVKVVGRIHLANGKVKKIQAGSKLKKSSTYKMDLQAMSETQAQSLAKSQLGQMVYDGFTGSITGFGTPRVEPGDTLRIENDLEPEKNSKYLVKKVTKTFSASDGISLECELGYKIL